MGTYEILGCVILICGLVNGTTISHDEIKDIIIGDPNQVQNDTLGPPISDKEMEESLSLEPETDLDLKKDPITTSGFFQGDIMVQSEDYLYQILEGDPEGQLSAIRNPQLTWPSGVIPYVISASFTSQERTIIARAMSEYHQKTCIRFVPRSTHSDYIHILRGQGCSSAVGRRRGVQTVSLGTGCVHFGIVIHELMHASGFWHEQSRTDRDSYVTIMWGNILRGLQYNFDKKSNQVVTDLGLPYDYSSIMHYGAYAFTNRYGSPTIVPRQRGVTIGQRAGFSELDVKSLNLLYKCSGKPNPKPSGCTDDHRYCSSWATQGYCTSNAGYMAVYCKKSCNVCGTTECKDTGLHCSSWAAKGECQRNPKYMKLDCKKSCNLCGSGNGKCRDENQFCQDWKNKGECSRNPKYMSQYCQKACGIC